MVSPEGLGKKAFRHYVELFLEPAFRNINNQSMNGGFAAQDLIVNMNNAYGNNVFSAIVEQYDSRYLQDLERIKNHRP